MSLIKSYWATSRINLGPNLVSENSTTITREVSELFFKPALLITWVNFVVMMKVSHFISGMSYQQIVHWTQGKHFLMLEYFYTWFLLYFHVGLYSHFITRVKIILGSRWWEICIAVTNSDIYHCKWNGIYVKNILSDTTCCNKEYQRYQIGQTQHFTL